MEPVGGLGTSDSTMRARSLLALLTLPLLALAACGDDDTSSGASTPATADPARVVLVYASTGGCDQMGPNCPTYTVHADGSVEVIRTGHPELDGVTGTVPAGLVSAWLDAIKDVDLDALRSRLQPGSCQACLDGVDTTITVSGAGGNGIFDSTVVAFDETEPFFHALGVLMTDVQSAVQLPLATR